MVTKTLVEQDVAEKESLEGGEQNRASTSTSPSTEDNYQQQQSQQNDLLTGRLKLEVVLPEKSTSFLLDVNRQTALLDILVNIANEAKLKSSELTIEPMPMLNGWQYKPTLPIGLLGTDRVKVLRKTLSKAKKSTKSIGGASSVSTSSGGGSASVTSELPFVPTVRLVINLPQRQKMVLRVDPNIPFKEIKPNIFDQRSLEPSEHIIVLPFTRGAALEILNDDRSLNDLGEIREVTVVTLREYQEFSRLSVGSGDDEQRRRRSTGEQVDISQSVPNLSRITSSKRATLPPLPTGRVYDNQSVSSRSSRSFKKKPAPPPPIVSASVSRLDTIEDTNEPIVEDRKENKPTEVNVVIASTAAVITKQPKIALSRQSSGSDSSGYHETLSSGGMSTNPSSPAPPVSQSSSPHPANNNNGRVAGTLVNNTRVISQSLSKIDEIVGDVSTRLPKKKKAPLPPPRSSTPKSATPASPTFEFDSSATCSHEPVNDHHKQSMTITSSASTSPEPPTSAPTSPEPLSMSTSSEPTTSCSIICTNDISATEKALTESLASSPNKAVKEFFPLDNESVHQASQEIETQKELSSLSENEAEIVNENIIDIQNKDVINTNLEDDDKTKEKIFVEQQQETRVIEEQQEAQINKQEQPQQPEMFISSASPQPSPGDDYQTGK